MRTRPRLFVTRALLNHHCSAGSGHHEHVSALAQDFVVNIHPNHGIGTKLGGAVFHFPKGGFPGFYKLTLIGT